MTDEAKRFAVAIEAQTMGPRLAAALGTSPRPCHVLDAKYEPGLLATVLYQHGDDLVRGDLLRANRPPAGAAGTRWPEMALSVFPDDPDLPTLPLVMTASAMGPRLAQLSATLTPLQRRALSRRCQLTLLRYRPGRRVTVRLGTSIGGASFVAKAYHDPLKAAAVAQEADALARSTAPGGTLRLAPTVGHFPDLAVVVQQSVHGQPLDRLLGNPGTPAAADAVQRSAAALVQLHHSAAISTRLRPIGKELHRFVARAQRISAINGDLGGRLADLAERLIETSDAFAAGPAGVVHGDCKPSQFHLAEDGGVYLLDFDHCGFGDQNGDAGTFVASLRQLAVRRAEAGGATAYAADLDALAGVFIATYSAGMGENLEPRIRWHEVVALQRKAIRAFARSPRSPLPAALVQEGHRCLDLLTRELS